jgi:hypothetical protein
MSKERSASVGEVSLGGVGGEASRSCAVDLGDRRLPQPSGRDARATARTAGSIVYMTK